MQATLNQLIKGDNTGYYIRELPGIALINCPWWQATPKVHNDVLYGAAPCIQRLVTGREDGLRYPVTAAYIEFDNSGLAVDPTPTVTRSAGLSYYEALSDPGDYLRVGISAFSEANTDEAKYELPNRAVFHVHTAGTVGVNGLPFSNAAGSRVIGGALVAARDPDDASQDIVLARFYYPAANQLVKIVGSQIGMRWGWSFL